MKQQYYGLHHGIRCEKVTEIEKLANMPNG
jgi:hypothetical protein